MFKKREYITRICGKDSQDVVTVGTILLITSGDKNTEYHYSMRYPFSPYYIRVRTSPLRYFIAKLLIHKYIPNVCVYDCPNGG